MKKNLRKTLLLSAMALSIRGVWCKHRKNECGRIHAERKNGGGRVRSHR